MHTLLDRRSESRSPDAISTEEPVAMPAAALVFDGAAEAAAAAARARHLVDAERHREVAPDSQTSTTPLPRRRRFSAALFVALLTGSLLLFASATVADIAGIWSVPAGR